MMCFKRYMYASNHESGCSNPKFFIPYLTPADLTERLKKINPSLFAEVRKVLDLNKMERHIRGGMATRERYAQKRKRA